MAMAAGPSMPKPEATDVERRVLAHERRLQALIAYMARTEPRFIDHLRDRFVEPMRMARHEHDHRETDDYAEEFMCAVMLFGDARAPNAFDVPDNAYATARSFSSGWACTRGHEEVGGASCEAITVAGNAHLRSSGYDLQCDRGYRQAREACVPIAVPENGYLANGDHGAAWACDRGFFEIDGHRDPVAFPANAFLDPASHGPRWRCERGFETVDAACPPVDHTANAHLDRSGGTWRCDRSFQLADGECVLGR